jgi:ferredoxin-like protein FixX
MKLFKRYTTEEFISRAKEVHGNKYDYSSVEYTHNKNKVEIICPKHGVFMQQARMHLKKQGCKECGYERVRGWKDSSRIEAHNKGEKFFEGKPCNEGHTTRYVSNSICVKCHEIKTAIWREENNERHKEMTKTWRKNKPERAAATSLMRGKIRNKRTKNASILWQNQEVRDSITAIYDTAKKLSVAHGTTLHVDHIVPLAAENVCGLHVPWNLQITTASYNSSKQNRLEEHVVEITNWQKAVLVHASALPWNLKETQYGD